MQYQNIQDMFLEGDHFWCATKDGVLIYDPNSNIWRPYQEESLLPSSRVNAFYITQNKSWFATEKGIAVFDTNNKTVTQILC